MILEQLRAAREKLLENQITPYTLRVRSVVKDQLIQELGLDPRRVVSGFQILGMDIVVDDTLPPETHFMFASPVWTEPES